MPRLSLACDLCGEVINGSYWVYDDNTVVCSWCEQKRKKCEICGKPITRYYYAWDNHVLCECCYENSDICDSCGNPIIATYKVFEDKYKICSSCYAKKTKYDVTLSEARELVNYEDIDLGRSLLRRMPPYLCIMTFSTTISRLSHLLRRRSYSKIEYISNSYYFCSREIKYLRKTSISPVEAIVRGVGNCAVKSALLASLLKRYGSRVSICTTKNHVFVITYYPSAPKEYRVFRPRQRRDETNWADWIGMDPASNCIFGRLPERDFTQIREHSV